MAREDKINATTVILTLSVQEAVKLVGLLTAQIGGVAFPGHMGGAVPEVGVTLHGQLDHHVLFCVDSKRPV